jgi:hypothetical protein
MIEFHPVNNEQMLQSVQSLLLPLLGFYVYDGRRKPAIYFDNAPETADVEGLEVIVPPGSAVTERNGCCNVKRISWYLSLVQHNGRLTIYDAVEQLQRLGIETRCIWNTTDRVQGLKPACVVKIVVVCTS